MSIALPELIRILQSYPTNYTLAACNCAEELLIMDEHFHEVRRIPLTEGMRQEEREMYGRS